MKLIAAGSNDAIVLWVLASLGLLALAGVMIARMLRNQDTSGDKPADGIVAAQLNRGRSESRAMLAIVFAFPAAIALMMGLLVVGFVYNASRVEPSRRAPIVMVYAAASTSDVMQELAHIYREESNVIVQCNFASSSTLAKQLQAGGRADVFLSANEEWMNEVEAAGEIDTASRVDLLANRLVLIAPAGSDVAVDVSTPGSIAAALRGRFAMGDPDHVPAGVYAKESLTNLRQWEALERRLAPGADVRVALRYVATGTADLGAVYATDASVEPQVRVVATLPESSHQPIRYPLALCAGGSDEARGFVDFLKSERARQVFERAGFDFLPSPVAMETSR